MFELAAGEQVDPLIVGILVTFITGVSSALAFVAKVAYGEIKNDRDFLRGEILKALSAIMIRMNDVARERDVLAKDLETKLDNIRRIVTRMTGGSGR